MAQGKELLESLGLEIAKRKYYNAAKVESVIEDFSRRSDLLEGENTALKGENTALKGENLTLRERVEALACGREEIGDAILSAKVISQQLIAEAKEQAEAILAEAREQAERLVAEAEEKAGRLSTEAEEKARALTAECAEREQRAVQAAEESYLHMREKSLDAVRLIDSEWQRFLCALGDDGPKKEPLPADLADKLGEIAQSLGEIEAEDEGKQGFSF